MKKYTRRQLSIIGVLVFTLILGIAAIYFAYTLQNQTVEPEDSFASGICCEAGVCNNGFAFGKDDSYGGSSCDQRNEEACRDNGGIQSGGGSCDGGGGGGDTGGGGTGGSGSGELCDCIGGSGAIFAFQQCSDTFCRNSGQTCAEAAQELGCYRSTFECPVSSNSCSGRPGCIQNCPSGTTCGSDEDGNGYSVCIPDDGGDLECPGNQWTHFSCPDDFSGQNCTEHARPATSPNDFYDPFCGSQQIDCNVPGYPPNGGIWRNNCEPDGSTPAPTSTSGPSTGGGTPTSTPPPGQSCNITASAVCLNDGEDLRINWTASNVNFDIGRFLVRLNEEPYGDWVNQTAGDIVRGTQDDSATSMVLDIDPNTDYKYSVEISGGVPDNFYRVCITPENITQCSVTVQTTTPPPTATVTVTATVTATPTPGPTATTLPTPSPEPTPGPACGDGLCDAGEQCDTGLQCEGDAPLSPNTCRDNCTYCGDGIVHSGEECDDGNRINDDSCSNICEVNFRELICGDGVIGPGEECEPGVAGSCGPGASCNSSCACEPLLVTGPCGASCTNDSECSDTGNTCENGVCILSVCSANNVDTGITCVNNNCNAVECGGACGAGGDCGNGMTCSEGICVLDFCANNDCGADRCTLPDPPTALISDQVDIVMISLLLILVGTLAYRLELIEKGYELFKAKGGDRFVAWFDRDTKRIIIKRKRKKAKDKFEDRF